MLYPISEIDKHQSKLDKLALNPENIRRYKKCSLDMWLVCIGADISMIKEMDAEDITVQLVDAAIPEKDNSLEPWQVKQVVDRLESLDFYGWTPALIKKLDLAGFSTAVIITTKLKAEFFDRNMAELFTRQNSYNHTPLLFNYPDLLAEALANKGAYLAVKYQKEQALTKEQILIALGHDAKKWAHGAGKDYEKRQIIELYSAISEEFKADVLFCDELAKAGFFMLLDEAMKTPKRAMLAATHRYFLNRYSRYGSNAHSPIESYFTSATLEKYVTSVPLGLEQIRGISPRHQALMRDRLLVEDLDRKAVGFDINNLLHVKDGFKATSQMVEIFACISPTKIWELPKEWVTDSHIELAIKKEPLTVLYYSGGYTRGENRLMTKHISLAYELMPSLFDDEVIEQSAISISISISLKMALNKDLASKISKRTPHKYDSLVCSSHRTEEDVVHVLLAGFIDVAENEKYCCEPYISTIASALPHRFKKWVSTYGYAMNTIDLNVKACRAATQDSPELLRVFASKAKLIDVVGIARGLNFESPNLALDFSNAA
jgi:hypothetical protein